MGILFVFVDGLGLGPPGAQNPLSRLDEGVLASLGREASPEAPFRLLAADATLGVPGLPQSATGGTALFTGVNAPSLVGRHLHGLPNGPLRDLLAREGLLRKARERGARAAFVNAYTPAFFSRGRRRRRSVTTVMTECAGLRLNRLEDLLRGRAVYRDFTNRVLREAGHDVPLLSPEEAGERLAALAREHDFLLYEYFQTDTVGHRLDLEGALEVLLCLDRFLSATLAGLDPQRNSLLLTSDHGNVEDMSQPFHTIHPVPLLLWGGAARDWPGPKEGLSICDIAPGVLRLLAGS